MPANYTAADALAYLRETLGNHLDWIHADLAEEYGLETIDGEEYLPGVLNDVMACLYSIHRDATNESVAVGLYIRDDEGQLYRPRTYSTGWPLYMETWAGPEGQEFLVTRLQHPDGRDLYRDAEMPAPTGDDESGSTASTAPEARRAGLHIIPGEGA